MTKKTVYIAGPMTGLPEFNFPAFDTARDKYSTQFSVTSPADHDREQGFDPTGLTGHENLADLGLSLEETLLWDLQRVADADGLILLKGWEKSSGARAELALAAALGKWVIEDEFGGEPIAAKTLTQHTPTIKAGAHGEVRTTSSTGAQKGVKPEAYALLPVEALAEVARHYGRGAEKYAAHNWRKGYEWSKSYSALQRHANAFWQGENTDEETGSHHMAGVIFHALSLITFTAEHPEFDDRWKQ
ncbi:dATP/dGTP diphosphohydrolase domain-containing protein [Timonella senegalensis]|uniref:dATP/dGTP diphosphohydrolase domain-containing protein n=1 Tax=Timonella senegalensis TaxID=1465825 RepID=UPI002FDC8B34